MRIRETLNLSACADSSNDTKQNHIICSKVTKLQGYKDRNYTNTKLPSYQVSNLPSYHVTIIPSYQITKLQSYKVTKLPSYQVTQLPIYQVTKLPSYQVTKVPSYQVTKFKSTIPRETGRRKKTFNKKHTNGHRDIETE